MFQKLVWTFVKVAAKKEVIKAVGEQLRNNEQVRENLKTLAILAVQAAQTVQSMQDSLKAGATQQTGGTK
ncbi:hypothetical protein [Actinoalloteichus hymeniacidonis]|uniref:Uncharacterized protein n=1 Tax=Actinoalloteichus hymeniacidonis TaxID=340345 RepID=A0AAC9HQX7_9PSEU|nr:hypothetical protein TL08_14980 [Actinoalloteichus hymeniacidonis]MBB5908141.1 hypothetical protein [Actinoalloteichus hymeniacidonis]